MKRLGEWTNRTLSKLLRYDLSRSDVVKWVDFARQTLGVTLLSLVSVAGISAALSIQQATRVLRRSLQLQGEAVAAAAARAAFVPLTLEDDHALARLRDAHRGVEHVGSLTIRDAAGKVRVRWPDPAPPGLLAVTAKVLPSADSGRTEPAGDVEVGMRVDWIDSEVRRLALANLAVLGVLTMAVSGVGMLMIRNLVVRPRELVGEARLVDEVRRVNEELETFSYSVAHDLRAPVRAVDGFSLALLEDHAGSLDVEGKDYLNRVRAASKRMGLLIDDLLHLSKVTRADVRKERVDLSVLAREIAAHLASLEPGRSVNFQIQDGISALADPGLIRTALENLLGNAWKYTQRREIATIQFGRTEQAGKRACFVKDDGAGFDMAFSKKLFKPFSRLHAAHEFEGTGIGLATVQRVVARHGGEIWAESRVGEGAVFYFTL